MPLVLWTTLRRLANLAKTSDAGGNTDGVVRGILSFKPPADFLGYFYVEMKIGKKSCEDCAMRLLEVASTIQ
jgi:hypothetical protein